MARARLKSLSASLLLTLLTAACAVGPDYVQPTAETPAVFKEDGNNWQPAQPQDAADRGAWWAIYNDPVLDGLEQQIDVSNQNLKASEAAYREAVALVDQTRSGFFPVLSVNGGATAEGTVSGKQRGGSTQLTTTTSTSSTGTALATSGGKSSSTYMQYLGEGDLSWTIDVWGKIRRELEANEASAEASAADLASARLSAQATLASTYFQLRVQDDLKRLLAKTVENDQGILKIITNQLQVGVAAQADVLTAQTQLESVQAQLINADVARAQYEHAIAVLIGKPPSEFSLPPAPAAFTIPAIPPEVPSVVLQRRPDVAEMERNVKAANAEIGVAVSAYYPDITISGSVQSVATQMAKLFDASSMVWSVGPQLAETVIDWGYRDAQVDQAKAAYDQSVANYRQTVLAAFQNVEDNLAAQRILAQQDVIEKHTVADARESERLTLNQYKEGIVPYNTVLVAQSTTLSNEQTALNVTLSRLTTSVNLIEALGGGWSNTDLANPLQPVPTPDQQAAATAQATANAATPQPNVTPSITAQTTPPIVEPAATAPTATAQPSTPQPAPATTALPTQPVALPPASAPKLAPPPSVTSDATPSSANSAPAAITTPPDSSDPSSQPFVDPSRPP